MSTKYLYGNGYPFLDPLPKNIDKQLERIENKKASCIIIDGAVGCGKTTLAVEIAEYINKKKGKGNLSLQIKKHPQISLGGKEFTGCFREVIKQNLPVIIYDEAGDFNRRGAISSFNQTINRLFETYRGFKVLVIICLPNFTSLDSYFFNNKIPRLLIHITDRGKEYGEYKVYSLYGMNWIRHWYDKLPLGLKNRVYSQTTPNFYGKFKNLTPDRDRELDILSTHGKKEFLNQSEKKLKNILSYSEIAEKINRSVVWVRKTLKDLKIKHKTIIEQKKYFDVGVVDTLLEEFK